MDYSKSEEIKQLLSVEKMMERLGKKYVKQYITTWNSTRDSGFECISPIEKKRFLTNGVKTR